MIETPSTPFLPKDWQSGEDLEIYIRELRRALETTFQRVYEDFSNGNSQFREVTSTPTAADLDEGEFVLYTVGGTFRIYTNIGGTLVWCGVSSTGTITDWSLITNKPSSSVTDIDSAVSLKHTQGTDQGLDTGGANATTAADVKSAVSLKHAAATAGDGISVTGQQVANTDKGSSAVSTHESTYDHTLIGIAIVLFGTLAARPAFGTAGRVYAVVGDGTDDNNGHIWLDTGTAWVCITPTTMGQLSP